MHTDCIYSTMALAVKIRNNVHKPMSRVNTRNPKNNFQSDEADCMGSMPITVKYPRLIWRILISFSLLVGRKCEPVNDEQELIAFESNSNIETVISAKRFFVIKHLLSTCHCFSLYSFYQILSFHKTLMQLNNEPRQSDLEIQLRNKMDKRLKMLKI